MSRLNTRDPILCIVGTSASGSAVVNGCYRFYETTGFPLDMLFDHLVKHNAIPCWISLYREARSAGMKHGRIISMIREALLDNYSRTIRDHVIRVLDELYDRGHPCLDGTIEWAPPLQQRVDP